MITKRNKSRKALGAVAILGILVAGAFAYTAANIVPASKAGDGSGTISGYTISNIDYTLDGTDFGIIDSVDFDVDVTPTAGSDLKLQLDSTGGAFYDCTFVATAVSCDLSSGAETVVDADEFRVIIVD